MVSATAYVHYAALQREVGYERLEETRPLHSCTEYSAAVVLVDVDGAQAPTSRNLAPQLTRMALLIRQV